MHSKNLRDYLDSSSGIAALIPQAERLIELRRIYIELLPRQLLRTSSIVNYKKGTVVIFAENNAIAAKLRMLSPRLINDFLKRGLEVTGIRLEVQPRETPKAALAPKRARLSAAGVKSLDDLARTLPNSKLKQAVADMAARAAEDLGKDRPADSEAGQARRDGCK